MSDIEKICFLAQQGKRDKDTFGAALEWDTSRIWRAHDIVQSGTTGLDYLTANYVVDALRDAALTGRTPNSSQKHGTASPQEKPHAGERLWWLLVLAVRFFAALYFLGSVGSLIALLFTNKGPTFVDAIIVLLITLPIAIFSWIECRRLKKKYPNSGWVF